MLRRVCDIQYAGMPGISKSCVDAVMRLIQYGDEVSEAHILSHANTHCLLLKVNGYEVIAVKSGFSSGYGGEGPRSFSLVLELLRRRGVEIDEYEVGQGILDRIDASALTESDVKRLGAMEPVRPTRWYDYLFDESRMKNAPPVWHHLPPVMPYSIIDPRLLDLANGFFEDPDQRLMTGYRRLEDTVRKRTGIDQHGQKLFAQAFHVDKPKLSWPGTDGGELNGRVNLFTGAWMAYRNPRAHREPDEHEDGYLGEFLLLNQLFVLEGQAVESEEAL